MKEPNPEAAKKVVRDFNKLVIEARDLEVMDRLIHEHFVNHSAPAHLRDKKGTFELFRNGLWASFSNLKVEIYDQITEGGKVTSRKSIFGTHTGELAGIPPTNKNVKIDVIDIVTVKNGQYFGHWGINSLQQVIAELKG